MKIKDIPETHITGQLSVESNVVSLEECDFGIQIAEDGRVWICIDGVAFIRFKPKKKQIIRSSKSFVDPLNGIAPNASA